MDQQTRDALRRVLEAQQALNGEIGDLIQQLMKGEEETAALDSGPVDRLLVTAASPSGNGVDGSVESVAPSIGTTSASPVEVPSEASAVAWVVAETDGDRDGDMLPNGSPGAAMDAADGSAAEPGPASPAPATRPGAADSARQTLAAQEAVFSFFAPADASRSDLPYLQPERTKQRTLPADLLYSGRWKVAYRYVAGRNYVTGEYPTAPHAATVGPSKTMAARIKKADAAATQTATTPTTAFPDAGGEVHRTKTHGAGADAEPSMEKGAGSLPSAQAADTPAGTQAQGLTPRSEAAHDPEPEQGAEKVKKPDFEWRLGLSWINKIGVGLLLLGLAFAAKFSYDHMTDGMRTGLLFVLGAAVLGAGELLNRKFRGPFALGITGGGIAILYLGAAVGYFYTERLSSPVALLVVVAVTALAFFLSLRHNAQTIAAFALVGGYLPVFVLRHMPPALVNGAYVYFLLLTAFALLIARKRSWKVIPFLAFLLNLPCMFYLNAISDATGISLAYTALSFAMMLGMALYASLRREGEEGRLHRLDMVLLLSASVAYTAALVYLVAAEPALESFRGLAALIMAGVYLGLSLLATRVVSGEKTLIWLFRSAAFAFSLAVIPMHFGYQWLPLAWNAECLALAIYARRKQSRTLAVYAKALLVITSAVSALRMVVILLYTLLSFGPCELQFWLDMGSWMALLFLVLYLYRRTHAVDDPMAAEHPVAHSAAEAAEGADADLDVDPSIAPTMNPTDDAAPQAAFAAKASIPNDVTAFTAAQWSFYVAFTLLAGWLFLLMVTLDLNVRIGMASSPWRNYWPLAQTLLLLAYPAAMRRWKSLLQGSVATHGSAAKHDASPSSAALKRSPAFGLSLLLSALMLLMALVVTASINAEALSSSSLPPMPLMLGAFGLLLFVACAELGHAWRESRPRLSWTALIVGLSAYDVFWTSLYLRRAFAMGLTHVAYSLLFLVLAVAWVLLGFRLREKKLRYGGLALSMAALFKLFVIDLHWLTEWRRVLSYIIFGLLLIGISYLYQLYAKKLNVDGENGQEDGDEKPLGG